MNGSNPASVAAGPPVATPLTQKDVRLIIVCAMTTMFLSVLDQTIVATSLPAIAADLGNFSLISWVVTSYLLTSSCMTPVVGKLSDLYGRRLLLQTCLVIFILSSVLCALAPSLVFLILARMVQGIGGGALATMAQTVISDVVSPRERGRYTAHMAVTWGSGSALGPMLGGLMTQYLGWHFIFWINLPLGLIVLFVADRALRKLPIAHRRSAIDYASILTLSCATIALLLVLSLGGKRLPWDSSPIIGLAVAAVVLGGTFAWQQMRSAEPILAPHFMKTNPVRTAILVNFVMYGGFLTIISLTPIYLQVALRVSPGESGALMIPLMVTQAVGSYRVGRYIRLVGRYKPPPLLGMAIATVMAAAIALFAGHANPLVVSFALAGFGAGMGLTMTSCQIAAQNAVNPRDLGAVNGSLNFARVLGGSVGIAIASAIVLGVAVGALPHNGPPIDIETLTQHVLPPETRFVIAQGFGYVFGGVALLSLIGLVLFSRIEERELGRDSPTPLAAMGD